MKQHRPSPSAIPRDKWKAIFLAFFLGSFGLHQFYLGNRSLGKEYLYLFWTGIPGVYGIFHAIYILFTSQSAFDRKYNMTYCAQCDAPIGVLPTRQCCDDCNQSYVHSEVESVEIIERSIQSDYYEQNSRYRF